MCLAKTGRVDTVTRANWITHQAKATLAGAATGGPAVHVASRHHGGVTPEANTNRYQIASVEVIYLTEAVTYSLSSWSLK